jgi:hypothetical protein
MFCYVPLFVHVCATDQFDTEVEFQNFRGNNFQFNLFQHALEILLETVHNDDFITFVESVGQLVGNRIKTPLHIGLFCINIEQAISLMGKSSNIHDSSNKGIENIQI